MAECLKGDGRVGGYAAGETVVTSMPISFWGGVEPETGRINDPRHELFGQFIAGKVLVFPFGKGSAAAPLVMLELAKNGKAPAAMINISADPLQFAGPIISSHFYGMNIPVIIVDKRTVSEIPAGRWAEVDGNTGEIRICERCLS